MTTRKMVTPEESYKRLLQAIESVRGRGQGIPSAEAYINAYIAALPMITWEDTEEVEGENCLEDTWERRDLYMDLSWEAKQVVLLILNSPSEIVSELGPKNKNGLSHAGRDRVCAYIRKKLGFRPRVAREVIDELSSYSRELGKF
jgi:hypothetical protein